ncbi:MAG: hypothetical protein HQK86_13230 [Nitrospinae bacterium]|nr:hypothetical protein [Nitrospinota bacterium]
MNTCQARAGIFTPKVCGASATASCSECGKAICFAHYRLSQGSPYCVECFAAKDNAADDNSDGADETGETDWEMERARIRRERESSGDSDYDDGDYMAFNSTGGSDDLSDDSIPPDSFQDS